MVELVSTTVGPYKKRKQFGQERQGGEGMGGAKVSSVNSTL